MFLILGIPLSWHKAALSMEMDGVAGASPFSSWSITVPETKLTDPGAGRLAVTGKPIVVA